MAKVHCYGVLNSFPPNSSLCFEEGLKEMFKKCPSVLEMVGVLNPIHAQYHKYFVPGVSLDKIY